jgi:hypothetical protein
MATAGALPPSGELNTRAQALPTTRLYFFFGDGITNGTGFWPRVIRSGSVLFWPFVVGV